MKNIKMNKFLKWGLFINTFYLITNRYKVLPDFLSGLIFGIGISLLLLGIYTTNYDIIKLKIWKRNLLKSLRS
jgi:hypothetical protein